MARLGIRRPRVAGIPHGLVGKASGYATLPGGATIPAGSQVTDATSMLGHLQARTAMGVNGSTPLPRDEQFWALMGPGAPLLPAPLNVPNQLTGQADPRRWAYPISHNITGLETGRLVDWSTLRRAAREVDLIAQCIRVRRTEQVELDWDITLTRRTIQANGIESTDDKNALLKRYSKEISRLIDFWSEPDTTNGYCWTEWVGMLLQEHLEIDAVSIFPEMTYGGKLLSLNIVDGATVKPLLDERGNRPKAPAPAYQQWLYGFPRGEYTDAGAGEPDWSGQAGSLIYKPRYVRVDSPYGYSSVEQALVSAELWLRRQQWMVAEYTQGTTPRMVLKATGGNYTPEQIRAWQDVLNDFYGGSTTNRHRIHLFPDGFDPSLTEDAAERYKADYDEFLVKLICAHMDVQPQEIGFTPRNGLGGAGHGESQEAITYRKALRPTSQWLVEIMNQISYAYLDMPRDLTFQFLGLDSEDEAASDQVLEKQFRSGRKTLNETRDAHGLPRYDFAEADMPMLATERGLVFMEDSSLIAPAGELVTPAQAPPLQAPEGQDTQEGSAAEPEEEPDSQQGKPDVAKAELAAYYRWAKKGRRGRPFEFTAVSKTEAMLNEVDLDRVVFKAGGATPKVQSWPGWERDLQVAEHYAPLLTAALTKTVDAYALAKHWLSVRKAADPSDADHWLNSQDIAIGAALRPLLRAVHTEGYLIGQRSAVALIAEVEADWGNWAPGNLKAAEALIGNDMHLAKLLAQADVTISSIAKNRLGDLAQVLADGLAGGDSVDSIARDIRGVLDDPSWADMVAVTETNRAVTYASLQTYLQNDIRYVDWITAPGACAICMENAEASPIGVGQSFPSGADGPPGHPRCRCAISPHV